MTTLNIIGTIWAVGGILMLAALLIAYGRPKSPREAIDNLIISALWFIFVPWVIFDMLVRGR